MVLVLVILVGGLYRQSGLKNAGPVLTSGQTSRNFLQLSLRLDEQSRPCWLITKLIRQRLKQK